MENILSLDEQIKEVINFYNKLKCIKIKKGIYKIYGELEFKVCYPHIIRGKYNIEIIVTKKFPQEVPIVKETSEVIPNDFHKNDSQVLCLGVISEMKIYLKNTPNLLKFINSFVIPYFYSFKIWQDTGKIPFGERSHSIKGIVEFYKEYLFLNNVYSIFNVLKYICYKQSLNGYCRCPCGSGKNINQCYHQKQLKELSSIDIRDDYIWISSYCRQKIKNKKKKLLYPITNDKFKEIYNI